MRQVLPLALSTGGQVLVEIDDDRGVVPAGTSPREILAKATASVSQVLADVRATADDALRTLRTMETAPSRVELEFGVTLTAEATAVITKAGGGANMKVTVVWERAKDGPS